MERGTREKLVAYALVIAIFIGAVYAFRVVPYGGDWSCVVANCVKVK